jgi:hypothetical protein
MQQDRVRLIEDRALAITQVASGGSDLNFPGVLQATAMALFAMLCMAEQRAKEKGADGEFKELFEPLMLQLVALGRGMEEAHQIYQASKVVN